MNDHPPLRLAAVQRRYRTEAGDLPVLRGADLTLAAGEIVALVAPSGTGKSTLLHLAGLLEKPDGGEVFVEGRAAGTLSDDARTAIRRTRIGFVYQFHHLLPEFSAEENIALPQMAAGVARGAARDRARELLAAFGLAGRGQHRPGKLSGGEQQRVAIARALANRPRVLLADEPTGNLDVGTSDRVFAQLLDQVRGHGVAALIATHNPELARRMDRIVTLRDGCIAAAAA
ncbi:ABC transporter ATP-binding protein [Roseomonas sp. CECT 9278]|uniref:ABC transporter ATP-binding protein n=1 Tax=Roseomonas sp. CECT 9278 TaxID=2845823 RepID=UPI001E3A55ED|nr:ABC transporter ATP-binding protein [Roseomonas sp. CECT 9278]CAH0152337.1 Lipoprotein-releasing system ATP-binding protein LolD [Roseomonas sp. CECT 9278]